MRRRQAIFGQEPKMAGNAWSDISDEAKDFVRRLLDKCAPTTSSETT